MKKKIIILLTILFWPFNIFAYSSKVIVGGESIGIEVDAQGVMVAGFYKINGEYNKGNPDIKAGDYILSINNEKIEDIDSMNHLLSKYVHDSYITLQIMRNDQVFNTKLKLIYQGGKYKTGLYVKDKITGIGTLTYIDPETNIYGALGHQITASDSLNEVKINGGYIFSSSITSINESRAGKAGSKNASINENNIYGNIETNSTKGIFGNYNNNYQDKYLYEIGNIDDVKIGKAEIKTVIKNSTVETFNINIIKINKNAKQKNILFEITDERLLAKTGGIVQGMSGSPIIQNNKLIGAVNYVVLDEPNKGYGIFITYMLEEGDKLSQ